MNEIQLAVFLAFAGGFVLQSLYIARVKSWTSLLVVGLAIATGILLTYEPDEPTAMSTMLAFCVGYSITYVIFFLERILRPLNPETLIFWNVLAAYMLFRADSILLPLAILGVLASLFSYATDFLDRHTIARLYYYCSYLVSLCAVLLVGGKSLFIELGNIASAPATSETLMQLFITGSATATVAVSLATLYLLVPMPGEGAINDAKYYGKQLAAKYTFKRHTSRVPLVVVVLATATLALNALFSILSDAILVAVIVTAVPHILSTLTMPPRRKKRTKKTRT